MTTYQRIDLLFAVQQHLADAIECLQMATQGTGHWPDPGQELADRIQKISSPGNSHTLSIETIIDLMENELVSEEA